MNGRDRIACDPGVMMGLPCIRGTEILVWQIVEELAAGERTEDILRKNAALKRSDLRAAVDFAHAWASENLPPERRAALKI